MLIDISRTISPDSLVFPGDDNLRFVQVEELSSHSHFARIGIEGFSGHVGSHVDVPSHVFTDGKTLDDYDVGDFVFDAVVHAVDGDVVDRSVVEAMGTVRGKAVLFKTRCSDIGDTEPFANDYVCVTSEKPGNYRLFAFPLKIQGGDGSCVRAVLESF